VSAQFHPPRVNPRCVAKDSRFVVSAQHAGPATVSCRTSSCARRRTGRDVLLCIVVFVDDESDSIATRGLWAIASKVALLCSAAIVDITVGSSGDTVCMQAVCERASSPLSGC